MNHGKMILEACVDSPESAEAAEKGGADRLELCGHLIIGGVTPDEWLYRSVREHCRLPVRVLIRPRFGDFCYTEAEFQMMEHQVAHFKKAGCGCRSDRLPETGRNTGSGANETTGGTGRRYGNHASPGI